MITRNTALLPKEAHEQLSKKFNILGILDRNDSTKIKYIVRINMYDFSIESGTGISKFGYYDVSSKSFLKDGMKREMLSIKSNHKRLVLLTDEQIKEYEDYEKNFSNSLESSLNIPIELFYKISDKIDILQSLYIYSEHKNNTFDSIYFNEWKLGFFLNDEMYDLGVSFNYLVFSNILGFYMNLSYMTNWIFKNKENGNYVLGYALPQTLLTSDVRENKESNTISLLNHKISVSDYEKGLSTNREELQMNSILCPFFFINFNRIKKINVKPYV